jgi:cobalt-zinc-cadmium efflux system protein
VEPRLIMLTSHVMIDDSRPSLELLQLIQSRITGDFGIRHMTIQLETECCDPDDIHCDLRKLAEQSHETGALAHHH